MLLFPVVTGTDAKTALPFLSLSSQKSNLITSSLTLARGDDAITQ